MAHRKKASSSATWRAAAWVVGALFSFMAMAVAGREISRELDTFQLMLYRSLIAMAVIVMLAGLSRRGFGQFATRRLPLHLLRNLVHFVGQFGWFYGIALIPLAEVFAIEFTTPLWVALLAPLLLGERLTALRGGAVLLGFVGVLIVIRPGSASIGPGTVAVLIAALGFAGTMLATKRLTATESPLAILFYMALIQAPLGLLPSLGALQFPGTVTWIWLFVVTLCGLSAHYCLARAFALADAVIVAPMDFLRLPLIALVGMALYAEPLDPWVFLGGGLILLGNYANLRAEARRVAGLAARP